MSSFVPKIQIASKLQSLFTEDARYRIAYGGRGSSKSWAIAQMLIVRAMEDKKLILCCREYQTSIKESSHRLLSDTIERMGVAEMFDVLETTIRCKTTGSEFIFKGLKKNASEVKSTEGIDIVWIEEANATSKRSWKILTPTIRAKGSEVWASFNPEDEEDFIYKRFVLNTPPKRSQVVKINFEDNPWFTDELEEERQETLTSDPDDYAHIWLGEIEKAKEGTYYAKILADMREAEKITSVPYDPTAPVQTWWDIGFSDDTAIWFVQRVGYEWRVIDYYQEKGEELAHYAKIINEKPYNYREHNLPHDAKQKRIGMSQTVIEQLEELINQGDVVGHQVTRDVNADIQAVRAFMRQCVFDDTNCEDGLKALRKYRRKFNDTRNRFEDKPLHDEYSNGADAFRYFAIGNATAETLVSNHPTHNENLFPRQQQDDYGTISDYGL